MRNGVSRKVANRIFDEMMDFASYAFNKSHAAAYAVVAYRTAWLKVYYPVEFLTALINSFLGTSIEKMAEYVYYCKQKSIDVLPPISTRAKPSSPWRGKDPLRPGRHPERGGGFIDEMVAEREKNGPFVDFYDFIRRSDGKKRMVEGLIKAGCFASMGYKRSQLLGVYEQMLEAASGERKQRAMGQISLFDLAGGGKEDTGLDIPVPDMPEYEAAMLLSMERETMGIYISGHPLLDYAEELKKLGTTVSGLLEADGTGQYKEDQRLKLGAS